MPFWTLKKAFDLVGHKILLSKLSVYLNSSNSLPFFCSYLKNRVQRVFIRGSYSSEGTIKYGVPQGQSWDLHSSASILMIYLCIYHQILQNVICSRMTPHFILVTGKSVVQIQKTLLLCLDRISVWCNSNHMLINPVKTKSMAITTRQKHQLSDLSLRPSLHDQNTENVTEHRLLGLIVDNKFR